MYRNNPNKSSKPILKCQQQTCVKSNESLENINVLSEKSERTFIRSTTKILNLIKKPVTSHKEEKQENNILTKEKENNAVVIKEDSSTDSNTIIFNVVIGKKSMRKHKKWEDDGTLEVTGKHAILKNTEGNIIHKTTVNPEVLIEGFRMYIDNKEIEIIDRVNSKYMPNKCIPEVISEPPTKKLKTSGSKPYLPLGSLHKDMKLRCCPLIMPSISISKNWEVNDVSKNEKEVSVDTCLVNVLRQHQRHGIVFLYECIMGLKVPNYFGAILADEMGLGKTLQCITIIWTLLKKGPYGHPILKYILIVTPSSLCYNWNKEFKHWLGFHRISPYVVNAKNKPEDFKKHIRNSVLIISYDMLIKYKQEIEQIPFDLIICDEGHRLKNNDIKTAKILYNLNCKRRILLTGTPIQNDLQEFFALIDFVNPAILGNNIEFKNYYEKPIVASQCPNASNNIVSLGTERASELYEKTKCFILRRTQETINKYLPSKHEFIVFCRLSNEQEDLYSRVTDSWFNKTVLPNNSIPHLTIITALKKICNHPELFNNEKTEFLNIDTKATNKIPNIKDVTKKTYCGKISIVQTLLRNLKKTDEKLVLISYYTQTLDLLETVCDTEGLQFLRLDGTTTSNTRSKIIERFNSTTDNSKIFLLSAKAGGVGLNLPGASRLILFDSDWNPASDSQAMARIWRDGQKKDVYMLRLLTTGTIEEKIFQRQISKASLSETVVDLNSSSSLKLSTDELKDLFTLATNTNCLTHDLMKCSCNGYKKSEEKSEESYQKDDREYQFLGDKVTKSNLTINQLLKWEHYQQPISDEIIQEIMLSEASDNITFILKNSVNKSK
ncbi:DNA repair and recombination protein RAD54B-like isoform X1 [Frieseomelitta varia]|uniref:DNA repair and recombination protein RAD54B-like isoform X1 n=2 Tax=Frieseomelitta varia TaxID=561572 RepID=UPI001CB6AE57|nr:DNA repair and recombination protein RAD54B-like isoform X1 [Frieseomelitta varia]